MHQRALFKLCVTLAITFFNGPCHASLIRSMTIEEIGDASSGLGTSLVRNGGGQLALDSPQSRYSASFVSAGSVDGAILMGTAQADLAFTPGFLLAGFLPATPNTSAGPTRGKIENGTLVLDLSGWGANVRDFGYFYLPPDPGTLSVSLVARDVTSYFYTADWSHRIIGSDDPTGGAFYGITTYWHLEGVATVPEPGTLPLLVASGLGLLLWRRRV